MGKPSKGTPADKRLAANKPAAKPTPPWMKPATKTTAKPTPKGKK